MLPVVQQSGFHYVDLVERRSDDSQPLVMNPTVWERRSEDREFSPNHCRRSGDHIPFHEQLEGSAGMNRNLHALADPECLEQRPWQFVAVCVDQPGVTMHELKRRSAFK